jgi:DNA repair protein RadC
MNGYNDDMKPYVIPIIKPYVLRDAPFPEDIVPPSLEGPEIAEVQELLKTALGANSPTIQAVKEYGVHLFRILHTVQDVQDLLHVSKEEGEKILAMIYFGRRLFAPSIGSFPYVRGIQDIDLLYRAMAYLPEEQLRVLLINNRYQIVHEQILTSSASGAVHVTPLEVLHPAVKRDMHTILLVHNHPSGTCKPSKEDLTFTEHIVKAAKLMNITVLDHVIIAEDGAASCLVEAEN